MVAPASKASCALSICSAMVIGTAGLLAFRGRLPVIATQMMQALLDMEGLSSSSQGRFRAAVVVRLSVCLGESHTC